MRKVFKTVTVAIVIAVAVVIVWIVYKPNPSDEQNPNNRVALIASLQTLEYKRADLTEEEKALHFSRFQKARDELNLAMELVQNKGDSFQAALYWPLIDLGTINRDVGDFQKAEAAYLYAHQLQPKAFPPLGNVADMYFRYLGTYEKAAAYYLQAVELSLPDAYAETYYSELHEIYRYHLNDQQLAEEVLVQGIEKYPNVTNILAQLAQYYEETGRIDEAIQKYQELLDKKPDSTVAKDGLARLLK